MLMVHKPSSPLLDALRIQHRLIHLPGLEPSINRAAGTRIAKTVDKVAVELCKTRIEKIASARRRSARAQQNNLAQT